jgi:hypothetical protein
MKVSELHTILKLYQQVRFKSALESHKRCVTKITAYTKNGIAPPPQAYWVKRKARLESEFPALKGVTHNESV